MPSFFRILSKALPSAVKTGIKEGISTSTLGRFTRFKGFRTESLVKRLPSNTPKSILSTLRGIGRAVSVVNTTRAIASNPIGFAVGIIKPLERIREAALVPISRGRVIGKFSQSRLRLSFLMDTIFQRQGQVDLTAYFRKPVERTGKKYIEVNHPHLNVDEITKNKSLYAASLVLRKLGAKRSLFTPGFFRTFEEQLEQSAANTIRDRWRNVFGNVRKSLRHSLRVASEEFHRGEITEEDYIERIGQSYERHRRIITLLSAGGIGRLSEQGLHKLDDMVRQKRKEFINGAVENLNRYNQLIQNERNARKEQRKVKDALYQKHKRAEKRKVQSVKDALRKATDDALGKNSKLNNYLRRRDPNNPKLFLISSLKQNKIKRLFRSLFDPEAKEPFDLLDSALENSDLPSQTQDDLKSIFTEGYGDILRAIRGTTNSEEIIEQMELNLAAFPNPEFKVAVDAVLENEELLDILQEVGQDNQEIEEGYRDGNRLDLEENEKQLEEKGQRVVYHRVTTSGDECPACSENEFTVFDTFEEARSLDKECYNVTYHGGRCYCEIEQSIIEDDEGES